MRAAPALHLTLTRFRVWHAALLVLIVADLLCLMAWAVSRPDRLSMGADIALVLGALAVLAAAWSARARPATLVWDGQIWHVGTPGAPPDRLTPGQLHLRIDLGGWMLLQHVPQRRAAARSTWLPVQRADLAPQWHALQCAASAPPAPATLPTFDPRSGD